ncbi:PREDICTED: uncharacterized protein LOC109581832 [Amphimedon queenslandica]|uniref:Uncharacterized protein n=1 Tax=Amphimedon queenslandica TaxID=400682 RepID=A0A1X7UX11_AMPQE|nr:PREDICTED: uncharacterized protein LOC109581832 [Amphimedon queenslandica]|eukprot:XP_019851814.1 PREDICTED: uncharacterized protein LOC109581832 [Amphimedon queenslandica]
MAGIQRRSLQDETSVRADKLDAGAEKPQRSFHSEQQSRSLRESHERAGQDERESCRARTDGPGPDAVVFLKGIYYTENTRYYKLNAKGEKFHLCMPSTCSVFSQPPIFPLNVFALTGDEIKTVAKL